MIRLLLVDDQPIVRQGLCMRLMLEPDITVVGEASSGEQALVLVESLAPDIVLMDVEMPAMGGISQLIRLIICVRHQQQRLLVFGLSEHN